MKTKVISKEVPKDVLKNFYVMREYAEMCDKKGLKNILLTACNWFDSLEEKEIRDMEGSPSSPYEFQVGDLVEVQGHPSGYNKKLDFTDGFDNEWVKTMDKHIGSYFAIESISKTGVKFNQDSTRGYAFPPQALKLIKKAK